MQPRQVYTIFKKAILHTKINIKIQYNTAYCAKGSSNTKDKHSRLTHKTSGFRKPQNPMPLILYRIESDSFSSHPVSSESFYKEP